MVDPQEALNPKPTTSSVSSEKGCPLRVLYGFSGSFNGVRRVLQGSGPRAASDPEDSGRKASSELSSGWFGDSQTYCFRG